MKKYIALILALAAVLTAAPLRAQQSIRVEVPNLVAADEQFNLTFVIEGEKAPSAFEWSPGEDFRLVWGPQKGTSTSISIVGGKRTRSSQTTYTYVLLPRGTGKFTLPSASATVGGKTIVSRQAVVEVVSDGRQGAPAAGSGQADADSAPRQERQAGQVAGEDLFLRLLLSKTRVVVGEPVTATLKLYQRVNISGFEDARFPSFKGFWSQELQAPSNIEFRRENLGEMIYNTAVLRSWTLIPQQSGALQIDPAEIVCLVNVRTRSSGNSIFDSFFQDDIRTVRKRVSTAAQTLQVSPLPAGAPASFGGGVGSYRLEAALTRDSLRTHDAASLRVTVSGTGNVSLLEAPKIAFPPDFEVYDVKSSDLKGGKQFEYPFIPRSAGEFVIGPVEYSYYDVSSGRYVTLRSQELPIRVERSGEQTGAAPAGGQLSVAPSRSDVRDLGSDIRYIRTRLPRLREPGRFFVGTPLFWTLTLLLPLLAAGLYLLFRRRSRRRVDLVGTRRRGATRMARRRLSDAQDYMEKALPGAFYEALHKALLGFVSDKFALPVSDWDPETFASRLSGAGVDETACKAFTELLDACAYARYAPSSDTDGMRGHYEQAVQVISDIDEQMKHSPKRGSAAPLALLLLLLLPAPGLWAQRADYPDSLWTAGVQAYADGRWEDAARDWTAVLDLGLVSPELYCNLGDAWFKAGETGRAVLCYERALKLDPSDRDARFNLALASARVQDRIDSVPEFFLKTWMRRLGWWLGSDAWAVLFLILFCAALAMALLFLLGRRSRVRKTGFFLGIVLLLLSIGCLSFSLWQRRDFLRAGEAVVMKPVTSVKSAPGGDATLLFVLHEGTKVKLLDQVENWSDIELSDGRQGWIASADIEVI